MQELNHLLEQNKAWVKEKEEQKPGYFSELANAQSPEILWIGCIDSRIPAEMLTGMEPGGMLVYRNIANQANPADTGVMSAIQFAVDTLAIKHIIITGHSNCGGVSTAYKKQGTEALHDWLNPIEILCDCHSDQLKQLDNEHDRLDRLAELNVEQQVLNVADTTTVQNAWKRGQSLSIHGCFYDVGTGVLKSLGIRVSGPQPA